MATDDSTTSGTRPDPAACRERLGRALAEEAAGLGELTVLLDREHELLKAQDVVALDEAIRERRGCVARLIRADEERRALCRQFGASETVAGLEQLMRWCDPRGQLLPAWQASSAAVVQARSVNDRNAAFVGARLRHVQERLGVLLGSGRDPMTYGPRGSYAETAAGRVVKTEV